MASSGMLRTVALVRTDVSEELSASIIRVTRIGGLGTTLAVSSNLRTLRRNTKLLVTANVVHISPIFVTLMMEALSSSETSVLTRVILRNIPEDDMLHIQCKFQHLSVLRWCEIESTWYVGHYLAYCTSPSLSVVMNVMQSVKLVAGETEIRTY
jgi:hypothetical protein